MNTFLRYIILAIGFSGSLLATPKGIAVGDVVSAPSSQFEHFLGTPENGSGLFNAQIFGCNATVTASVFRGEVVQLTYIFSDVPREMNKLTQYAFICSELRKKPKPRTTYEIVRLAGVDIVHTAGLGAQVPDCFMSFGVISEETSYQLELSAAKLDGLAEQARLVLRVLRERDLLKPLTK